MLLLYLKIYCVFLNHWICGYFYVCFWGRKQIQYNWKRFLFFESKKQFQILTYKQIIITKKSKKTILTVISLFAFFLDRSTVWTFSCGDNNQQNINWGMIDFIRWFCWASSKSSLWSWSTTRWTTWSIPFKKDRDHH